jgi:hypothetical protein
LTSVAVRDRCVRLQDREASRTATRSTELRMGGTWWPASRTVRDGRTTRGGVVAGRRAGGMLLLGVRRGRTAPPACACVPRGHGPRRAAITFDRLLRAAAAAPWPTRPSSLFLFVLTALHCTDAHASTRIRVTTTSARSDAAAAGVDPSGSSFIHLSLDGCQIGEIYIYDRS